MKICKFEITANSKNKKIKNMFGESITLYFNNRTLKFSDKGIRCGICGRHYNKSKGGFGHEMRCKNNVKRSKVNIFLVKDDTNDIELNEEIDDEEKGENEESDDEKKKENEENEEGEEKEENEVEENESKENGDEENEEDEENEGNEESEEKEENEGEGN